MYSNTTRIHRYRTIIWHRGASQDFSVLEILLLCLLVYAGAAQFIICALVITGTPISQSC